MRSKRAIRQDRTKQISSDTEHTRNGQEAQTNGQRILLSISTIQ